MLGQQQQVLLTTEANREQHQYTSSTTKAPEDSKACTKPGNQGNKKKVNFIEKNRQLVQSRSKLAQPATNNNMDTVSEMDEDNQENELIIRCLNDIKPNTDKSHNSPAEEHHHSHNEASNDCLSLDTSNQIVFDISIISNHSSISSDIVNPKKLNNKHLLEAKSVATTNSSLFKFDSGLARSNFDENEENSHNQMLLQNDFVQNVLSIEERVTDLPMNSTKGEDLERTELSDCYVNVLAQGCYDSMASSTLVNGEEDEQNHQQQQQQDTSWDHVNIQCNDDNLSKVRSQFMQRFASSAPRKRQIIPNLIGDTREESTMPPIRINEPQQHRMDYQHHCDAVYEPQPDEVIMQVASDTIKEAIGEPLAKIQSELEAKISNVLCELDTLRRKDEILTAKLVEKSLRRHEQDERAEEKDSEYRVNLEENQTRIQYLENLQEKQFDMMSQLISMIGKENTNATLTASSGRESLMRFRRQLELDEPLFRDPDDYLRHSDLFVDQASACAKRSSAKTNRSNRQQQQERGNSKSRSRNPSRTKKRSQSRSGSRGSVKGKGKGGCSTCHERKSKGAEANNFLEELLVNTSVDNAPKLDGRPSPVESPKSVVAVAPETVDDARKKALESKSAVSSVFEDTIYDTQPTLFDKYLHEAKNANKLLENIAKKQKELANSSHSEKPEEVGSSTDMSQQRSSEKKSLFTDIKEVLRAVEYSKSQIDVGVSDLLRARDIKVFNLPNYHTSEKNERIRLKKLVDGCVSAISNDVQKEVSQKLIDESKHVKLEAERDTSGSSGLFKGNRKNFVQINREKSTAAKARTKAQVRATGPVGFGSSAARSDASSDDTKGKKGPSESSKYIGKVFGKALLDQIKLEEMEERNERMRKQLEDQKELKRQLELQKQQTRLFKNISNNGKKEVAAKKELSVKQPAQKQQHKQQHEQRVVKNTEVPLPVPHVPQLALESARSAFQSARIEAKSDGATSNVALISITPRDNGGGVKSVPAKQLRKQDLPSLSINPTSARSAVVEVPETPEPPKQQSQIHRSAVDESVASSLDLNQSGAGIHLPGYNNDHHQQQHNIHQEQRQTNLSMDQLNDLSSDTINFLRQRTNLEQKAFDWIEKELISKFLTNMVIGNDQNTDTEHQIQAMDQIDPDQVPNISMHDTADLSLLGAQGLKLIMDMGDQMDPDFMQALIRECLEEKVNSVMIENLSASATQVERNQVPNQPAVSPRKRSLERSTLQNFKFDRIYDGNDVATPVMTPENQVIPGNYTIGTQVSFEEKSQPKIKVQPIPEDTQQQQEPKPTYYTPNIQYMEEISESLLDETFTEETAPFEHDSEELRQINIPETPNETESLEFQDNQSQSEITPVPSRTPSPQLQPRQQQQPQQITRSTSVQCDPMPVESTTTTKPTIVDVCIDETQKSDTIDLTQSTQYTSEASTCTTSGSSSDSTSSHTTMSRAEEDDSYLSEGAWLLSKSEGQIIPILPSINVVADSNIKNGIQYPGQRKASDGELKINLVNNRHRHGMELFAQFNGDIKGLRHGINVDKYGSESGEVILNSMQADTNSEGELKTEREVQREANAVQVNPVFSCEKVASLSSVSKSKKKSTESKKSKKSKSKKEADKTFVDLSISPEKTSKKNNIQIQSIPNEVMVRDSRDVERKIYSSTPDQSMLIVQPLATTFLDDEDFSHYTNYEDEEDGQDDNTVELETISESRPKKKSSTKGHPIVVTSTVDFTER